MENTSFYLKDQEVKELSETMVSPEKALSVVQALDNEVLFFRSVLSSWHKEQDSDYDLGGKGKLALALFNVLEENYEKSRRILQAWSERADFLLEELAKKTGGFIQRDAAQSNS